MCYDGKQAGFTATAQGALTQSGVAASIADFLNGTTCGEDLLHALYDHILDEPIPQPIRALLNELNDPIG
jgi:hypothetical protein